MRHLRLLAGLVVLSGVTLPLAAYSRWMPPPAQCGARCGLVPDGDGGYMDCGPCLAICGNQICQPGIGETHDTCPADCPAGPCVSEGCLDRCGAVRDNCARLLNCGPCPSSCGDGICDPGEWIACQDDCGNQCQPRNCGMRCGLVDDGCGYYLECPPCDSLCGNGLCENGESNASCPEDCPPPGCVSSGCNGGCGSMVDNCGQRIECGTCGGYSQCPHPNGICEPDLGEDAFNCKWECPIGCGDGLCSAAEPLRCPSDCAGTPSPAPDGLSAGGPYVGLAGEAVHFFGRVAPSVQATVYEWSFGDGAGASTLTATHTYSTPGIYEVRLSAMLTDGSELVSFTSARIRAQAGLSGFGTSFDLAYDPFGDGIVAVARIAEEAGGPPSSPKMPTTALAIWNPYRQLVDQTGWIPTQAESNPTFVPQLAHPIPGTWYGRALFGYVDAANPFAGVIYLGDRWATAHVPSQQCPGCLVVEPRSATIDDGATQNLAVTLGPGPLPDVVAWQATKPASSGASGSVEFDGTGLTVGAHATWFAQPDQACVSRSVLADQALRSAQYTVSAAVQVGSQLATGQAALTVRMPWGIGQTLGGTQYAAATFPPPIDGEFNVWCPTSPTPSNPCRITGNTLVRKPPVVCWPETQGHRACSELQGQHQLMPASSSFRHKVSVHEAVHVDQYQPGRYYGDLWNIDGPKGLLNFIVPGKGIALRNLTAPSRSEMERLIAETRAAWRNAMDLETRIRKAGSEPEAYAISDGVLPTYLLQGCNALR